MSKYPKVPALLATLVLVAGLTLTGAGTAPASHGRIPSNGAVGLAAMPSADGYWVMREVGSVEPFGDAPTLSQDRT